MRQAQLQVTLQLTVCPQWCQPPPLLRGAYELILFDSKHWICCSHGRLGAASWPFLCTKT